MRLFKGFNLTQIDEETMEGPIVRQGLLEDDIYKFLMGQFVFKRPEFSRAQVLWRFKNRTTGVSLANHVNEKRFEQQLGYLQDEWGLTSKGRHYLGGMFEYEQRDTAEKQMFSRDYLEYLCNDLHFPTINFSVTNDRQLDITWEDKWISSSMLELPILKIVNGLYYRSLMGRKSRLERHAVYAEGIHRLCTKVALLKQHPTVMFSDFGNRRRFGGGIWQRHIDEVLADELPKQFWGTSNTYLAMELGLRPVGTCAHEISMVASALLLEKNRSLSGIQNRIQKEWNEDWGYPLAISLPDTYGTDFCLKAYSDETIRNTKGFRADSGDPIKTINSYIKRYEEAGVDPKARMAIPSDGLDIPLMIELSDLFKDKILISHGLGTHLTNDLGLPTLSIVCKADSVDGLPCVKLSDNVAKATGDPKAIKRYKKAAHYASMYDTVPDV